MNGMPARGPHRAAYLRKLRQHRAQRKLAVSVVMAQLDSLNAFVASLQEGVKQEDAQKDQLLRQCKLNELFERLIIWRRANHRTATMGDMLAFYKQARTEFGFTHEETSDVEKAVENLCRAEHQAGREFAPIFASLHPQPPTFIQWLRSLFL